MASNGGDSHSEDGNYLLASTKEWDSLRIWKVETGHIVASINQRFTAATFAAGGRVLVVAVAQGNDHEIRFHDLAHADRAPGHFPGEIFRISWRCRPMADWWLRPPAAV